MVLLKQFVLINSKKGITMKKTILSILAGATMLSSAAFSAPAMKIDATDLVLPTGDQVISDLYNRNTNGINNNNLSKYDQAWMIIHDKDTLFKHKTFWVRAGKVFTGIAVDDLKDLNKSERSELIGKSITAATVEAALKDQKEMLEATHAMKIAELSKASEDAIAMIAGEVTDLRNQINDIANVIADVATAENVSVAISDSYNAGHADGVASVDVEAAGNEAVQEALDHIASVTNFTGTVNLTNLTDYFSVNTVDIENAAFALSDPTPNGFQAFSSYEEALAALQSDNVGQALWDITVDAYNQGAATAIATAKANARASEPTPTFSRTDDGIVASVAINSGTVSFTQEVPTETGSKTISSDVNYDADTTAALGGGSTTYYAISIDDTVVAHIGVDSLIPNLDVAIADAYDAGFADGYADGFADGYSEGYSDGFEDGYSQGYDDGFTDGVNSVR